MKRPLKPSEVPPGSVVRMHSWTGDMWGAVIAITHTHIYAGVIGQRHTRKVTFESLARDYQILRPGQDWQPCHVEEFCKDDYKPGQEVDVETARKLHAAGVKLIWAWEKHPNEFLPVSCFDDDDWKEKIIFRLAPAKVVRDIRPDELPERFEVVWNDSLRGLFNRSATNTHMIRCWVNEGAKWRTDLNAKELNKFTVEESQ
jgi:hypothetical protein